MKKCFLLLFAFARFATQGQIPHWKIYCNIVKIKLIL